MKFPGFEELTRILLWIIGSALIGFGAATEAEVAAFMTPEVVGGLGLVIAAVWRIVRGVTQDEEVVE